MDKHLPADTQSSAAIMKFAQKPNARPDASRVW